MNLEVEQIMADLTASLNSTGKGFSDFKAISIVLESICDKALSRGEPLFSIQLKDFALLVVILSEKFNVSIELEVDFTRKSFALTFKNKVDCFLIYDFLKNLDVKILERPSNLYLSDKSIKKLDSYEEKLKEEELISFLEGEDKVWGLECNPRYIC